MSPFANTLPEVSVHEKMSPPQALSVKVSPCGMLVSAVVVSDGSATIVRCNVDVLSQPTEFCRGTLPGMSPEEV